MARRSEVELCFDSMSDLITNLAGGLILVVMLLLAITREAPKMLEPVAAQGSGKEEGAEKPTNPLVVRLNKLRNEVAVVDEDIENDRQELQALNKKADALIERIKAAGTPAGPAPEKK